VTGGRCAAELRRPWGNRGCRIVPEPPSRSLIYARRVPVPEIQSTIGYECLTVVNFDSVHSFTLSPVAPSISGPCKVGVLFFAADCRREATGTAVSLRRTKITQRFAAVETCGAAVQQMLKYNTKINSNRENEMYNVRQIFIELLPADRKHDKGPANTNADTRRLSDTDRQLSTVAAAAVTTGYMHDTKLSGEPTSSKTEVNWVL